MRYLPLVGSMLSLFILNGCAAMPTVFPWNKPIIEATAENPAIEVVCLWEPAEGRDPQGMPTRGFNGQFLFFTKGSDEPAKVDGTVKIYVFDEYGSPEQWGTPVSEFEFAPDEWSTFLSRGMLGSAYQMFVPYMRKHSDQANCTIRVRFTPADGGPVIFSRVSKVTLPGMRPDATTDGSIEEHVAQRQLTAPKMNPTVTAPVVDLAAARKSRFDTIHRWNQTAPEITVTTPSSSVIPASHLAVDHSDSEAESALFESETTEEAPRHRFRLDGIAAQVGN